MEASLLILLCIVVIFIVAWMFNLFLFSSEEKRSVREIQFTKLSKYLNLVKGFTRTASILSVHEAVKEIAVEGGGTEGFYPRDWICSGDVSPDIRTMRYFLSERTLAFLNNYLVNLDIEDFPDVGIRNFSCVDYDVETGSVMSGMNDEKFNVGAYGSKVNITFRDNTLVSSNDLYQEISQVRFWYMYRKFKEWVRKTSLVANMGKCLHFICDCVNNDSLVQEECGSCPLLEECVMSVVNESLRELNETFNDEFISCTVTVWCCHFGSASCSVPECEDCCKCNILERGELCAERLAGIQSLREESLKTRVNEIFMNSSTIFSYSEKPCVYWRGNRLDVSMYFSCTDKKYFLSTEGDRTLTFNVGANVDVINPYDCLLTDECERNEDECCEERNGNCTRYYCKCPDFSWCIDYCSGKCEC